MTAWKYQLDKLGHKEVDRRNYTIGQHQKHEYVTRWLSPSVQFANCGWHRVEYCITENKYGQEEWAVLYANENDLDGRYICVSANSSAAIAEEVWKNIW